MQRASQQADDEVATHCNTAPGWRCVRAFGELPQDLRAQAFPPLAPQGASPVPEVELELWEDCPSTHRRAREQLVGCRRPRLVIADAQSAGQGSRGRGWASPPGNGLYASLGLPSLRIPPQQLGQLGLLAGVAARRAVLALSYSQTLHTSLKFRWPNDLVIEDAKLAGLLLETQQLSRPEALGVVLSFGLNLKVAPAVDQPSTALAPHLGRGELPPTRAALATAWLRATFHALADASRGRWPSLIDEARAHQWGVGRELSRDGLRGTLEPLDVEGWPWLRTPDGRRHRLTQPIGSSAA